MRIIAYRTRKWKKVPKDEDWFLRRFQFIEFKWKKMKILLEATTKKRGKSCKFRRIQCVCEKNSRHSIWLRNLDSVSVGIIDLTFFTFSLTAANHHPFPPPPHQFFYILIIKILRVYMYESFTSAPFERSPRM